MTTTNATQAASGVASKDGGRRGVRAAVAAGVVALGLATVLGLGHGLAVARDRGGYGPAVAAPPPHVMPLVQWPRGTRPGY